MNLDTADAISLVKAIRGHESKFVAEVMVFPGFLFLESVKQELKDSKIGIGAQNVCANENGAYTGEVSASQLKNAGIEYVLVGHSERREYFGETHNMLRDKLLVALNHDLKPVFCCGEPLEIRKQNTEQNFVLKQLEESLFALTPAQLQHLTIAYEPVWAIGTGLNASTEQAQEMHLFIRQHIQRKYGEESAQQIRILYGGSVKPANAAELFSAPDVDGGLVGGASLIAKDFLAIIDAVA